VRAILTSHIDISSLNPPAVVVIPFEHRMPFLVTDEFALLAHFIMQPMLPEPIGLLDI
jgi:hypothetical protein